MIEIVFIIRVYTEEAVFMKPAVKKQFYVLKDSLEFIIILTQISFWFIYVPRLHNDTRAPLKKKEKLIIFVLSMFNQVQVTVRQYLKNHNIIHNHLKIKMLATTP